MLSVLSVGLMGPFIGMSDGEKARHVIYRTFVLIHLYNCSETQLGPPKSSQMHINIEFIPSGLVQGN